MTSSNGSIFRVALLALCAGNSPVTSEFPAQRPVMRSFDVFFNLHLNKWLSEQSLVIWDAIMPIMLGHAKGLLRITSIQVASTSNSIHQG